MNLDLRGRMDVGRKARPTRGKWGYGGSGFMPDGSCIHFPHSCESVIKRRGQLLEFLRALDEFIDALLG